MKYALFVVALLFLAGCATSEPSKTVKLTEEQCSTQGGIIIDTDGRLSCLSGSRPYMIIAAN
jgi:hypothetical protein